MFRFPPIIMLHHVSDSPLFDSLKPYSISTNSFMKLLKYLEKKKYKTTTFVEELELRKSTRKRVIITIDDCSKELLEFAVPELVKRGMKAVFYMPTAHLGLTNSWDAMEGRSEVELMDAKDLKQLADYGMEIGGHSHHHIHLNELQNEENAQEEILTCKEKLEAIIQKPILSFAFPYGALPKNYDQLLRNAGFKIGLAIQNPIQNSFGLRRLIFHDGDTNFSLGLKLSLLYHWYRMIRDKMK